MNTPDSSGSHKPDSHQWLNILRQVPAIVWTTDMQLVFTSSFGTTLRVLGLQPDQVVGMTVSDYLQSSDSSIPILAAHHQALAGKSATVEQHLAGRLFQVHVEPLHSSDGTRLGTIGVALDITERLNVEQALRRSCDELEQLIAERTGQLETVNRLLEHDIQQRLEMDRELQESETRFRVIAETIPIPIVIVRLSDDRIVFSNAQVTESFGPSSDELHGLTTAQFYEDPGARVRILELLASQGFVRDHEVQVRRPDGSLLWLSLSLQPLTFQGERCALVVFVDFTHRKETEEQLLKERRLLQRLLELHERDRQLVAYEIHDGLVQQTTGALMFLEAAQHELQEAGEQVSSSVTRAMKLLRESISEGRRLISGLRPPILEEAGIVAAIENLITELADRTGLHIAFVHQVGFERLAPALEMAIFRIVQEALNNVWQHSQSERAEVRLLQPDEHVEIVIEDWGIGFDPGKVKKRRYGLAGLRERARLLGGQALIDSTPGQGTRVRVHLPLSNVLLPPLESKDDASSTE